MDVDGSYTLNSTFSRSAGNEAKKGYYPTHKKDIEQLISLFRFNFGYKSRGQDRAVFSIFDPCAGEGQFLSAMKRAVSGDYREGHHRDTDILSYALELDEERAAKIRGAHQKHTGSFFDTDIQGGFSLTLLNPPYNRQDNELLPWLKKAAECTTYGGYIVFIAPDYEVLKDEMRQYLDANFKFVRVFKSENYAEFKQLLVILGKGKSNRHQSTYFMGVPEYNLDHDEFSTIKQFRQRCAWTIEVSAHHDPVKPMIVARDMEPVYAECAALADKCAKRVLERVYPDNYDTSLTPISSLRTAHAVQLAAMNSQVESVRINNTHYLAKYMVVQQPESYKDPETNTETIFYRPQVEAFLLDQNGNLAKAKDLGLPYYDLHAYLSEVILKKLNIAYKPLHETGSDPDFLKEEMAPIGLMPPQREAIKALVKGYQAGHRGLLLRAHTGTGKSYMGKALKIILGQLEGVERTVMVTEPHLVAQMVAEYENEPFDVHVIDSWQSAWDLARRQPKGLYLISYTQLRSHPQHVPVVLSRKVLKKNKAKELEPATVYCCPHCFFEMDKAPKKTEKAHCPRCNEPLYTYVPENKRPKSSYARWVRMVESGQIKHVKSHNKQLPFIRPLKKIAWDYAIIDEAHNAGNLHSNQGAAYIRLMSKATRKLAMTATVSNGMAKSFYNILWGLIPERLAADGWNRKSVSEFQGRFGAFKQVKKGDNGNRHSDYESVRTADTAGVSPAILAYTLPVQVSVDADDFEDMPPVHREMIRCAQHPKADEAIREMEKLVDDYDIASEDRMAIQSVKAAAVLRLPDSFAHYPDELTFRGDLIGTVSRRSIGQGEMLEKQEHLVRIVNQAISRGERVLIYTGLTQKVDMRPIYARLIEKHCQVKVDVLKDSVAPRKITSWFEKANAPVVVAPFKRCGTGLNLSQFLTVVWADYTDESRRAEQGDGRIRRVNTSDLHRKLYGKVRSCNFYYLVTGEPQGLQLSYTLEKRMVSKLSEGVVPDIDPSECGSGAASFTGVLTKCLQSGVFNYTDPSKLLRKMTASENARVKGQGAGPPEASGEAERETEQAPASPQAQESFDIFGETDIENRRANHRPAEQLGLFDAGQEAA